MSKRTIHPNKYEPCHVYGTYLKHNDKSKPSTEHVPVLTCKLILVVHRPWRIPVVWVPNKQSHRNKLVFHIKPYHIYLLKH